MIAKKRILILEFISVLCFLLGMYTSANAQQVIKVYNKNKEVTLSHELFYYNGQYYLNFNDLQQLNLEVSQDKNTYTITSNDCLGKESMLEFKAYTFSTLSEEPITVENITCSGTYNKYRSTKTIGYSSNIPLRTDTFSFEGNTNDMIKADGALYISAQFIGNKMSHGYSLDSERMDFYISDNSAVITDVVLSLVEGTTAPPGGHNVKLYTAYKIRDGNTIDDFKILSDCTCTIPENETGAVCAIETPSEKITDSSIYFIADFGKRYSQICTEYDFSHVGKILVYGQQKDIKYTVTVNLPEIDEQDVPFKIYVEADKSTFSKQGAIKSGKKSFVLEFEELPIAKSYSARIEFDYHKYKNAVLEAFSFLNIAYAKDFNTDFTAEYSRSVVCNVGLPDDFVYDGDIEVKVQLSKYINNNSVSVVNSLTDWIDYKTVILNQEKRSELICLYSQADASRLSYEIVGNIDGMCQKGYLHTNGKTTSSKAASKKLTEDISAEIKLLRQKKLTVKVYRPFSLSCENEIFASVALDDTSTYQSDDVVINFTTTPLIASGESKSQFEVDIAEDKTYSLEIKNITGDEQLLDYYYYVKTVNSPADEGKKQIIGYSDDDISLTLQKCNNVSGTIKCEKTDLNFDVLAVCTLYDSSIIYIPASAKNGKFSLKIPEDTDTYTLDVQTTIGKKSYYVSDGVSSNDKNNAANIDFEDDDKSVVLEYILQNPQQPVEISAETATDYFILKNVSDYAIDEYDAYVAYYDMQGNLISVESVECDRLASGQYLKVKRNNDDYKIKKVKAFAWKNNSLVPIGNVSDKDVNQPSVPEKNLSVFKIGEKNAIINGKEIILNTAPVFINNTIYISADDFEKLGYKITDYKGGACIEKDEIKYKFIFNEYTAARTNDAVAFEIAAPIIFDDGIWVPVSVISALFDEKSDFYGTEQTVIINMPFVDVEYGNIFCKAILDMYYKGIVAGYEDGTFCPDQSILRSEAAVYFSRAMGHEFLDYEFECSDIPAGNWAASWVGICINENIFELEDNKFRPNDNITLKEAVTAVLKMKFANFYNYLETAQAYGLLTNISIENPERNITRAEMLQLLYNLTQISPRI